MSLHRYTYVGNDPVNKIDPSGMFILEYLFWGNEVHTRIGADFVKAAPETRMSNRWLSTIVRKLDWKLTPGANARLRPDLVDLGTYEIYEIKPLLLLPVGLAQLVDYWLDLNMSDPNEA